VQREETLKTVAGSYRFDRFVLDPADRRLSEDGRLVELSGRYLDALILMVAEDGRLVTKARLLDEVWKGVPVTEEALTQCVRSLRKALGDDASRPRFIETVPRHGYRFIASVTPGEAKGANSEMAESEPLPRQVRSEAMAQFVGMGRAGLIGGGAAGLVGGLAYGFAGVADGGAGGAVSGLLVLAALTALVGMIGGGSVGLGIGAAGFFARRRETLFLLGGACGGLVVGAVVRLAGLDAFALLFGSAPRAMTGAGEGVLLGAAIGAGVWIARGRRQWKALLAGAVLTGSAGASAALLGGRLMGGSLAALAAQFPRTQLRLDHLGALFGEATFGSISQAVTAGLEGALFGAAMVLALSLAQRQDQSAVTGLSGNAAGQRGYL
jgi:DNA-binding winged helix-turn-helix (wHTH) protein